MQYYKHIQIKNLDVIQQKTNQFIIENGLFVNGFNILPFEAYVEYCPEIQTCLEEYDLAPVVVATYITVKQEYAKVHVDYINPLLPQCRVNIPIQNCKGSATEFYSGGKYKRKDQDARIKYLVINNDETLEKVDEVEIVTPTIIRVQEPHRVRVNERTLPRICLTLQTDKDPVFLLN